MLLRTRRNTVVATVGVAVVEVVAEAGMAETVADVPVYYYYYQLFLVTMVSQYRTLRVRTW